MKLISESEQLLGIAKKGFYSMRLFGHYYKLKQYDGKEWSFHQVRLPLGWVFCISKKNNEKET